ncbi:MAG: exosome complex protein Rrp42 [Candidatus Woesearchaeota archaeon]
MNKHNYKPHIMTYLEKNMRYDGRKKDELREIVIEKAVTSTAEGSARVKIGDTEVIAGVKMELGTPYPDTPDEGSIMVGAEFLPIASADFEVGPPKEDAIELARVVDRGVRESGSIDLKKLCIKEGSKMWIVSVDVCTINDAGNLLDASGLAAIAAIEDAVFPEIMELEDDRLEVDYKHKSKDKLPVSKRPIPVTVFKIGDHFIVDPTKEEEAKAECRLTITSTEDGKLCALQKGGEGVLSTDDIVGMLDLAVEKANEMRGKL